MWSLDPTLVFFKVQFKNPIATTISCPVATDHPFHTHWKITPPASSSRQFLFPFHLGSIPKSKTRNTQEIVQTSQTPGDFGKNCVFWRSKGLWHQNCGFDNCWDNVPSLTIYFYFEPSLKLFCVKNLNCIWKTNIRNIKWLLTFLYFLKDSRKVSPLLFPFFPCQ